MLSHALDANSKQYNIFRGLHAEAAAVAHRFVGLEVRAELVLLAAALVAAAVLVAVRLAGGLQQCLLGFGPLLFLALREACAPPSAASAERARLQGSGPVQHQGLECRLQSCS